MLFAVDIESRGAPGVPMEQFLATATRAWEYLDELRQQGIILAGGKPTAGRGARLIVEVDSLMELEERLTALPSFAFVNIHVTPLTPLPEAAEWMRKRLAAIKQTPS